MGLGMHGAKMEDRMGSLMDNMQAIHGRAKDPLGKVRVCAASERYDAVYFYCTFMTAAIVSACCLLLSTVLFCFCAKI